ncbi:raftlin-like [Danio aesculapii]|uniref:raftlin-like n=1 Tax=Danio aesculapii TaxID=1142201 RepID=UPI0024BFAB60|nr:raftlin-like [Danio aesculapii]
MGCGLRKLRQAEDNSPGKIYSTLKRPQVETKTGISYTYNHLDFVVGKDADGTSSLCLSSVRDLPSQLQDLYQQGFILTAVHPFIHPSGPESSGVQRQIYRALLIRVSDGWEKNPADFEPYHLKLEECMSAEQIPSTEHIQGYVKKQIQDAADQGIIFVGFIQEPAGLRSHALHLGEPEEASLSLHSSPSSLHGSGLTPCPSPLEEPEPELGDESGAENQEEKQGGEALKAGGDAGSDENSETLTHNNNDTDKSTDTSRKTSRQALNKSGAELFGLFNYPGRRSAQLKYYTVKVPLRVETQSDGVWSLEANWLDHMTQHFNNGASLVDGYFQINNHNNDALVKTVDSVFVFQEGVEGDTNAAAAYDAIVVEQWTIIDGLEVKTDYIPLLQSLASFGWRLTCVLPTPITKTNSDGSLATKQIVFLQRPVLPRKKKESKKVIFKARNKSNKNSVKDAPKNKKKKDSTPTVEKEISDQKVERSVEDTYTSVNERRPEKQNNEADAQVQSQQKQDTEEGKWAEEVTAAGSEVGGGKQEEVSGNGEKDGSAKDEVDGKAEEQSVKIEAETGSCKDQKDDDEVDKPEEPSANQD